MTNDSDPATRERLRALLDRVPVDIGQHLDRLRSGEGALEHGARGVAGPRRVLIAVCALALSFLMIVWLGVAFRSSPRPPLTFPPCTWSVVPSPNYLPVSRYNYLNAVSADAPNDVWAIGAGYVDAEGGTSVSTILHWDGSTWHQVGATGGRLQGISAESPSDVWTIGRTASRFDGSGWQTTTLADPGTKFWNLSAVHAVSPSDVWAVGGTADPGGVGAPLIEHWDGSRWSIIPTTGVPRSPLNGATQAGLSAVSVGPDGTVWAVGEATTTTAGGSQQPLILRGDPSGFATVAAPPPIPGKSVDWLFGVAASVQSAVAVGSYSFTDGYGGRGDAAFALRWDGAAWNESALPAFPDSSRLDGVAYRGDETLAVGSAGGKALILTRSGSSWTQAGTSGSKGTSLQAISVAPDGSVWVVGSRTASGGAQRTLTMRCA